ncbi:hypothetical protein, partial [Cognatilysobacter terrigena]
MRYIAALSVMLLAGCAQSSDSAIAAAVLSSPPHPRLALCLNVSGADPSPALAAELRRAGRTFTPLSGCSRRGAYVFANGRPAESVTAECQMVGLSGAEVTLSSYFSPMAASTWVVALEWRQGRWQLKDQRLQSISMAPN